MIDITKVTTAQFGKKRVRYTSNSGQTIMEGLLQGIDGDLLVVLWDSYVKPQKTVKIAAEFPADPANVEFI